jgi:hypothetical protein
MRGMDSTNPSIRGVLALLSEAVRRRDLIDVEIQRPSCSAEHSTDSIGFAYHWPLACRSRRNASGRSASLGSRGGCDA